MERLAILIIPVLTFLMPASVLAQVDIPSPQTVPGGIVNFSGSLTPMSCTNGWTDLNIFLKEPAGAHVPIWNFTKNLSVTVASCLSSQTCTYGYSFTFNGFVEIEPDWPPGEYEIIAAAPFDCSNMYGVPYAWRGTKKETAVFQVVNASSFLPTGLWNFSTNPGPGWKQAGFDDSSWSADTSVGWRGLSWICTRSDGYGRCKEWGLAGSADAYFRKRFWLNHIVQTDFLLDINQNTDCWVNTHHLEAASGTHRKDITPYLKEGDNLIACHAQTQHEKKAENLHNYWSFNVPSVDCTIHCQWANCNSFTCSDPDTKCIKHSRNGFTHWNCYKPTKPRFSGSVVFHKPDDILWSNDDSSWFYGETPVQSDSWYLEKSDYYNPDGTVYTGIGPWSSGPVYFRKWFFPDFSQGTLLVSSTTEPACLLNNNPLQMEETGDDWWVYRTEVSGLEPDVPNLLACVSPGSDYFNLFDVKLQPLQPRKVLALANPFEPVSGKDGVSTGSAGQANPTPAPASGPSPAVPLAAGLVSIGAVGTGRLIHQRRPGSAVFWEKITRLRSNHLDRMSRIEEENSEWKKWKLDVRNWHRERSRKLETARIQTFLSALDGTYADRLASIKEWRAHQRINFRTSEDLLNSTTSLYSSLALIEQKVSELHPDSVDIKSRFRIADLGVMSANQLLLQEMLSKMRSTKSTALLEWQTSGTGLIGEIEKVVSGWVSELIRNNVLGEGEDSMLALGAALSIIGSATQDVGRPVGYAGVGCLVAGAALMFTGSGASIGIPVFAAGETLSVAGMMIYAIGSAMKTLGDSIQGWACVNMGDIKCVKRAKRKAEWNMLDAALELVSVKLPNFLKSKMSDRALEILENFLEKIGLRKFEDEIFGGIISLSTDVIKEPFKGLDMEYDPYE